MISNSRDSIQSNITADFINGLMFASHNIPEAVEDHGKDLFLNGIAAAMSASEKPGVQALVAVARRAGGLPMAPVPGRSERFDVISAAGIIGAAIQTLDFDDTHLETIIHPTAACLGAVLSVGCALGVDGGTALKAFIVGSEAQLRLGTAMAGHYERGWHSTSTCGVVGSSIAAAVCLGLDVEGIGRAVAAAVSQTTGHRSTFGTDIKPIQVGKATSNGVLAAYLAAEGFSGPRDPLGGARGFFRVMSPEGYDSKRLIGDFGSRWEIRRTVVKPYPCGVVSHPAIDAAEKVAAGGGVDVSDIVSIEILCHPLVQELTGITEPKTDIEAQFSTAHGVAVALLFGALTLNSYTNEVLNNKLVRQLREKVKLIPDSRIDRKSAMLKVILTSNRVVERYIDVCKGAEGNQMSRSEIVDKVVVLLSPIMNGRESELIDFVQRLDEIQEFAEIGKLLAG